VAGASASNARILSGTAVEKHHSIFERETKLSMPETSVSFATPETKENEEFWIIEDDPSQPQNDGSYNTHWEIIEDFGSYVRSTSFGLLHWVADFSAETYQQHLPPSLGKNDDAGKKDVVEEDTETSFESSSDEESGDQTRHSVDSDEKDFQK